MCQVWLHRYCAGVPSSRFAAIASSFLCSACSITASASIVAELRNEIAALKNEVAELRVALRSTGQKLEKELCAQVEALAASQNATSGGRAARPRPVTQQHRSISRRTGQRRHGSRPPRAAHHSAPGSGSAVTNQRKPCIPVEGKRKLWGTRRTTTASTILPVLSTPIQASKTVLL